MNGLHVLLLFVSLWIVTSVSAQDDVDIVLSVNPSLNPDVDCITLETGALLTFGLQLTGDSLCDHAVIILKDDDPIPVDTFLTENVFDFRFETPGQYIFFCGAKVDDLKNPEVAVSAICFRVVDLVPTMTEWGVAILLLLLLIAYVLAVRSLSQTNQEALDL